MRFLLQIGFWVNYEMAWPERVFFSLEVCHLAVKNLGVQAVQT